MIRPGLTRQAQNSGVPLPLPMRTSVGFFDTGTSGKMRIHTRPERFISRVMARRAASIWRAVTRSGSSALRPNEPNVSSLPEVATPWMRPLNCLRNLVRTGCSMAVVLFALGRRLARRAPRAALVGAFGLALLRGHRVVLHDLALEHPHLHPAGAVGGIGGRRPPVRVRAPRVEWGAGPPGPPPPRGLRAP